MPGDNAQDTTPIKGPHDESKGPPVVPVAQPAAKVEAAPAAAPDAKPEPKRVKVGAADEIPTDADLIELPKKALAERLRRHTSAKLKERFGTDDEDEIAGRLKKLADFEAAEEKRRVESLNEIEREKDRAAKAEARATAAEAKAAQLHDDREFERNDRFIVRVAEKYFDEDFVDVEIGKFAAYLTERYPGEKGAKKLDTMSPKKFAQLGEAFFAERLKAKPKHGKDYEESVRKQAEADAKAAAKGEKKPVTNGADHKNRKAPTENGGGDDKKLGQKPYSEIKKAGFSWR